MKVKMRKVSVLFSVGLCLSLLVVWGCRSEREGKPTASSAIQKKDQEQEKNLAVKNPVLKVTWIDVYANYVVTINGFPARERWVKGRAVDNTFDVPLQAGLVRGKNEVEVRLRPRLRHQSQELKISGVEFMAKVLPYREAPEAVEVMNEAQVDSAYARWSKRAENEWERILTKRSPEAAIDSIKIWAGSNPLTVTATFDNEAGPDFSRIFEEAPRLPDTPATRKRLKGYAMRLRELFETADTAALYREHKLKFESNDTSKKQALSVIGSNWLRYDWHTDFTREDLTCRRWSDGRVWEIYRDDEVSDRLSKQALFLTGEDRLVGAHTVYVAEIDGELKVVR